MFSLRREGGQMPTHLLNPSKCLNFFFSFSRKCRSHTIICSQLMTAEAEYTVLPSCFPCWAVAFVKPHCNWKKKLLHRKAKYKSLETQIFEGSCFILVLDCEAAWSLSSLSSFILSKTKVLHLLHKHETYLASNWGELIWVITDNAHLSAQQVWVGPLQLNEMLQYLLW